MLANLRPGPRVSAVFFVLLGLLYPLAETAIGQGLFSHQANGSLTADGSTLVGQTGPGGRWFQGRPDADNPMATGGTNLGPRSKVLVTATRQQIATAAEGGITPTPDLVTTSGSGVDPDISPADAYAQVNAVAQARGLPAAAVRQLVAAHIVRPQLGFLGRHCATSSLNEAWRAQERARGDGRRRLRESPGHRPLSRRSALARAGCGAAAITAADWNPTAERDRPSRPRCTPARAGAAMTNPRLPSPARSPHWPAWRSSRRHAAAARHLSIATTALVLVVPVVSASSSAVRGRRDQRDRRFLVYDFFFIPPYLTLWVGRAAELGRARRVRRGHAPGRPVVAGLNAARARERRQGGRCGSSSSCPTCWSRTSRSTCCSPSIVTALADVFGSRQVALFLPQATALEIAASAGRPAHRRAAAPGAARPGRARPARRPARSAATCWSSP